MKKRLLSLALLCCISFVGYSQNEPIRVLFVGNSYVSTNNLPLMLMQMSIKSEIPYSYSTDQVVAPGGYTFMQHCSGTAMSRICEGNWDYVVLQEQSQYPSFPIEQVERECFPYAKQLVDSVYAHNPCAVPVFYMTWGRENGDQENAQYFPPLGTYEGMDSLLYERYMMMKEDNDAAVSPVGRVWRYIRNNHPDIDLYSNDGSHPSVAGTYAAAATFYTIIHQADPMNISYFSDLPEEKARIILQAVKAVAYDSINRWLRPVPMAQFTSNGNLDVVVFGNTSQNATNYYWNFGDGSTSEEQNPTHTYSAIGEYTVTLVAQRHCMFDTITKIIHLDSTDIDVSIDEMNASEWNIYPNPATTSFIVQNADERIQSVAIYDVAGRMMKVKEVDDYTAHLDVQALDKGLYIIRITTQAGSQLYRKVVVE